MPDSRQLPSVRSAARSESGTVLALAAFVIPVFLLLAALVVDVGNWLTHDRQLQNRADAGAFAAGVDYAANWAACVQSSSPTLKVSAAAAIEAAARRYAGDAHVAGSVNTEIANQAKLDVILNSSSYASGSDWTDGGGPCQRHVGDDVSPAGGYWLDVKLKERNLSSLFGALGLPLSQATGRARIAIHPAVSDDGFIPLAVPETEIVQAQVRYYDECASPRVLLASTNLKPLNDQYQTMSGTILWGPDTGGPRVDPSSIPMQLPPATDCLAQEYISVGVEVRVGGRPYPQVDLNQTCAQLVALRFADCWSRLAEIRLWKGNPRTTPWFQQVELTGAGGTSDCGADPYFARNTASCRYTAAVYVDWLDRDDDELDVPANFSLSINGTQLSSTDGTASGWWTSNGTIENSTLGSSTVRLSWSWTDRNASHTWGSTACTNGASTPCKGSAADIPVHRLFRADDANAGIVDVVRTSQAPQAPSGQPGFPLHSILASGSTITVFPTIGLRSALTAGQYRVLRAADSQGNQSVDCEPTGGQGHDFEMFYRGCTPFFGFNRFGLPDRGVWWAAQTPAACPDKTTIFAQPNDQSDAGAWKCVPAAPGFSASVIADGIAARTGNCVQIQSNACSRTECNHPSFYPSTPSPDWAPPPGDPRVVNLFVVPYGAFKGVNAQDGLPITKFPRFYVTGWGGHGSNADPCPGDDPAQAGEIVGYFIAFGEPGGAVDETIDCVAGDLTPCRAILVR